MVIKSLNNFRPGNQHALFWGWEYYIHIMTPGKRGGVLPLFFGAILRPIFFAGAFAARFLGSRTLSFELEY